MLTIAKQIELAITFAGKSKSSVARSIGMTQQNFSQKLKRETFKREDVDKIAEAVGGKLVVYFEFPDGTRV